MQGGEERRKESSVIPKARGQGSPCFILDCTAQDPKGNWEGKRESSNTEATAQRMEGRSQKDGGKKPSLVVALAPAQKHSGKYLKIKNINVKKNVEIHPHQSETPENVSQSPVQKNNPVWWAAGRSRWRFQSDWGGGDGKIRGVMEEGAEGQG